MSLEALEALRNQALLKTNAQRAAALANQENEYRFNYPVNNVDVPLGNIVTPQSVQIGADGDFFLSHITGSFDPETAGEKKISVRITDQGRGNTLTDGFAPLWLFCSPGLITDQLFFPYKFNYIFRRTSTILLEFINASTTGDAVVNILLHGKKVLKYN